MVDINLEEPPYDPFAQYGTPVEEEDWGIHACTPWCNVCNERLTAQGHQRFYGASISYEGWDDSSAETESDEIDGWCDKCRVTKSVYWCYGETETCRFDFQGRLREGLVTYED